jgi:hypothetical protein
MIANLVHKASHSSMEWEVSTTDWPPRIMSNTQFHNKRRAPGSMPVVGSSFKKES